MSGTNTFSGGLTQNYGEITIVNGGELGTGTYTVATTAPSNTAYGTTDSPYLLINNTAVVTIANNMVLPAPSSATYFTIGKTSGNATNGTIANLTGNISGGNADLGWQFLPTTPNDSTTGFELSGNNTFVAGQWLIVDRGVVDITNSNSVVTPPIFSRCTRTTTTRQETLSSQRG